MAIEGMNHFNVLSDDVDATRRFYVGVLGMVEGERPPFGFPGLWLYAGGKPILHISGSKLPAQRSGVIEHIAFTSTGLAQTVQQLNRHGVEHTLNRQVGTGIWQIFCHDPMGARVELDFDPAEEPPEK
jgi:catechol 2,3-dioxygenase-like lactoylglutathione lyase family enzyme